MKEKSYQEEQMDNYIATLLMMRGLKDRMDGIDWGLFKWTHRNENNDITSNVRWLMRNVDASIDEVLKIRNNPENGFSLKKGEIK